MLNNFKVKKPKVLAYICLIIVVIIWGLSPIFTGFLYEGNSASFSNTIIAFIAAVSLFFVCLPKLKEFNSSYLKIAIPTGLFNALASLLQKIGLQFSNVPSQYAFLENLSCVIVPILLFIFIRKKPNFLTIIASVLCLVSSVILTGAITNGFSFGIAQILFAVSGVLYGVNIAATGVYAKKFHASLYVFIQMCVQIVVSLIATILFNYVPIAGKLVDPFRCSFKIEYVFLLLYSGALANAACWVIRTNAMKHVSPTVVAVIMPFSAVVTSIVSVIIGSETFSYNLVIGALLGLVAAILSGMGDVIDGKELNSKKKDVGEQDKT